MKIIITWIEIVQKHEWFHKGKVKMLTHSKLVNINIGSFHEKQMKITI